MSERTVSTAYSGTPSQRPTIAARARSGRSATSPSTSAAIAGSGSGSSWTTVARRPEASDGRSSSSSGRVRATTYSAARGGLEQVLEQVEQPGVGELHVLEQQHHRLVGAAGAPTRSRNVVHAANRSVRSNAGPSHTPSSASTREASQSASATSVASGLDPGPDRRPGLGPVLALERARAASGPSPRRPRRRRPRRTTGCGRGASARRRTARRRTSRAPSPAGSCPGPGWR